MKRITSGELCDAIEAMHAPPEWACFFEVPSGVGYGRRRADAIAMSLWPSRGLTVRGFEIKVDIRDFRRELANPDKAETIAKFCDEWWIVAPAGLVKDIEMPTAWGLMEYDGKALNITKKAVQTEAEPLTRRFVAAIVRKAHEQIEYIQGNYIRHEDIQKEVEAAREAGMNSVPSEIRNLRNTLESYKTAIAKFKELTGIGIIEDYAWNLQADYLGRCVKAGMVLEEKYGSRIDDLDRTFENAEKEIGKIRAEIRKATKGEKT
jgi:hypothetical protein